ncbi:MAG: RNA methyltransferase [Deltaproteobacteria bacterium]|jgi:TrmH family RNA methyltransferase|nr:RNA methyltransferase [Deltaproteobacteria bacterium]
MSMKLVPVSSSQNDVFKALLKSTDGRGDFVLVHGLKLIDEVLRSKSLAPKTIVARNGFALEKSDLARDVFSRRFDQPVSRLLLDDALFDQLDPIGVPDALAAFERPPVGKYDFKSPVAGPSLMAATQNPANLGALIRSAAAFGIKNFISLKEAAHPLHPKTVRGSMGYVLDLQIFQGPSIHDLGGFEAGAAPGGLFSRLVTLDLAGDPLQNFIWPKDPIVLVGEEGRGVPKSYKGSRILIPHLPSVDSLNAAVSGGIALYDFYLKTESKA